MGAQVNQSFHTRNHLHNCRTIDCHSSATSLRRGQSDLKENLSALRSVATRGLVATHSHASTGALRPSPRQRMECRNESRVDLLLGTTTMVGRDPQYTTRVSMRRVTQSGQLLARPFSKLGTSPSTPSQHSEPQTVRFAHWTSSSDHTPEKRQEHAA